MSLIFCLVRSFTELKFLKAHTHTGCIGTRRCFLITLITILEWCFEKVKCVKRSSDVLPEAASGVVEDFPLGCI